MELTDIKHFTFTQYNTAFNVKGSIKIGIEKV